MTKHTEIEEKVIKALGQWDSEDWIISASKSHGGAIHFSVHIETKSVDCSEIEVQEIEVDGLWLRITGWLK
jgi:hypothetical protein